MPVIRLAQDYAVDTLSHHVREAQQSYGEECILVHSHHNQTDRGTRCSNCWDESYQQADPKCLVCYGTGYENVHSWYRMWAIFADYDNGEAIERKGTFEPFQPNFQCESYPKIVEHDFIIRVKQWGHNHEVLELGQRNIVTRITETTVRTGSRFGQNRYDVVGQSGQISALPDSHAIYQFPIPAGQIHRYDERYI